MKKVFAFSLLSLVTVVTFAWQNMGTKQPHTRSDYSFEIVPLYLMTASSFMDAPQTHGKSIPATDITLPMEVYQCRKPVGIDWNTFKTAITTAVGAYNMH
jgi:hypothetical protein